jgi:predicted dithiol-disulfide oxidoreductase (DUF899 family)
MGWTFTWVSSADTDFNYDYEVSFHPEDLVSGTAVYNYRPLHGRATDLHGVSVFARDESGAVFHTYSAFSRGIDILNTAYNYLDLVPKGRDEDGRNQYWVRRHDEYGAKLTAI